MAFVGPDLAAWGGHTAAGSRQASIPTADTTLPYSPSARTWPQAQLGHSLIAVHPNCSKENEPGTCVARQAAVLRRRP